MKGDEILLRRLDREIQARKKAERIFEQKALELHDANKKLQLLNENLEKKFEERVLEFTKQERLYKQAIDFAQDIIFSINEEGFFTFMNPRGIEILKYPQEEIIGKHFIKLVKPEYRTNLIEHYVDVFTKKAKSDYKEFPVVTGENQVLWAGQKIYRVQNEDGTHYYSAVVRNITQRINTESELEKARLTLSKSEIKYRSVLENMNLGLMEVSTDGIITKIYDKFCEMLGYKADELLGKNARKTLLVESFNGVMDEHDKLLFDGDSGAYEVQLRKKNGEPIWLLVNASLFTNETDEVTGSLAIHYDLTSRKELEYNLAKAKKKAEDAQQAEQLFLANMSHEIRTPLNAIIGMTSLIQDTGLNTKQLEYVDILLNSASLLKELVSDILDISKINAGAANMNMIEFDLKKLIQDLIKPFQFRANDKKIALNIQFEIPNHTVKSDKQWISQILVNLISNAIKFTSYGEITVLVELVGEKVYKFSVIDTGIGMNEKEIERIFSSFSQANRSVSTEYGGTGLGLAITSKLIGLMGGELVVKSQKDIGSTFTFMVELESVQGNTKPKNKIEPQTIEHEISVLVAEDNLMNQKYISTLLKKWKVSFDIANNGQEAIDKFQEKHFDLIFMDLSMPEVDGFEATRAIRKLSGGNDVKIVALTASSFLSKKKMAMDSGMNDFLSKPFVPQDLLKIFGKYKMIASENSNSNNNKMGMEFHESLDRVELEKIYGDDYEYAYQMFETFLSIITEQMNIFDSVVEAKDLLEIKRHAHKLKPTFTLVGLTPLSECCSIIERIAMDGDLETINQEYSKITTSLKTSLTILESERDRLKNLK